jgi:hypothetical protein
MYSFIERIVGMIQKLSNGFLIQSYSKAKILKLDSDFIFLLEEEIKIRKLLFMREMEDEYVVI